MIKKFVAVVLSMICVASMALSASAYSVSIDVSFGASGNKGYSTDTFTANGQFANAYVSYVSFNGMTANAWPVNKYIKSALYSGTTRKSKIVKFTARNQVKSVEITGSYTGTYRVGAWTDSEKGATITESWGR